MPSVSKRPFDASAVEGLMYFPYRVYSDPDMKLLSLLQGDGIPVSLGKGDCIRSLDFPNDCFLVKDGTMVSFIQNPDDSLMQSAYYLQGSMFLQLSALSKMPARLAYFASEPTELIRISASKLKRMMLESDELFDSIMRSMAYKLYATREQQRGAKLLDVRERIYIMLMGFAKDVGTSRDDDWLHIGLKLTQQAMSDMLCVNRVTVNTALQDLYDAGLVKKDSGYYLIKDAVGILKSAI